MNKILKKVLAVLVMTLFVLNLAACGNKSAQTVPGTAASNGAGTSVATSAATEAKKEPVTIKYATFSIGTDPGAPLLKKQLEDFPGTKLGEGVTVQIEEIPGASAYAQKMKLLIASGDLPDVIAPTGVNYLDLAVKAGKAVDLTPYFNADEEFKSSYDPKSLKYNSRDGKIYGIPCNREVCYIYYNKELFQKAGIEIPKTWDEFWQACDKLKAANITPMGMDTTDFAWLSSLMLFAFIGTDGDNGNKWANTTFPKDYNTPEVIKAFSSIQRIFKDYTTKDAVGGKYDAAADHFFKGDVAMIANGPWMIGDFRNKSKAPEGFYDKVGIMLFPQDGMISVPLFGYLVGSSDKKKADAAVNFIRYITSPEQQLEALKVSGNFPESPKCKVPDELLKNDPLLANAIDTSLKAKITFGEDQAYWYPNTLDTLMNLLPELAFSKITPEEMCKKLTETAQRNKD